MPYKEVSHIIEYLAWICPACKLKNHLGIDSHTEDQKGEHRCKFCHSVSEVTVSQAAVSKVRFKRHGESPWVCASCLYHEGESNCHPKWRSQTKDKLQYYTCCLDGRNFSTGRNTERAVCDKRAIRQANSGFLKLIKCPSGSQKEFKMLLALQSYSELGYMVTQIYAFCKGNRLGYIVAYESPLFEFNLPQNNYFLVSLSIK